jgi:hypothetical protein
MGKSGNAYKVLEGKAEGKQPLGRYMRRWKDNIKIGLEKNTLEPFELDTSRSGWG